VVFEPPALARARHAQNKLAEYPIGYYP